MLFRDCGVRKAGGVAVLAAYGAVWGYDGDVAGLGAGEGCSGYCGGGAGEGWDGREGIRCRRNAGF